MSDGQNANGRTIPDKIVINLEYDDRTKQIRVFAPMANIQQKMVAIQVLAQAINVVINHVPPSGILQPPAGGIPSAPKNGHG